MKVFERSIGNYLIWCGIIYLVSSFTAKYTMGANGVFAVSIFWLIAMCLPLFSRRFAKYLNTETIMDSARKKSTSLPLDTNMKPSTVTYVPKQEPHCHYTVGTDTDGNVVMKLHTYYGGVSTLTMNTAAVRHLIGLLEAAIIDEKHEEGNKAHD